MSISKSDISESTLLKKQFPWYPHFVPIVLLSFVDSGIIKEHFLQKLRAVFLLDQPKSAQFIWVAAQRTFIFELRNFLCFILNFGINNVFSLCQESINQGVLFGEFHSPRYVFVIIVLIKLGQNYGASSIFIFLLKNTQVSLRFLMKLEGVFSLMCDFNLPKCAVFVVEKGIFPNEIALM